MAVNQTLTYSGTGVNALNPGAKTDAVALGPSLTLAKGTVLGQVAANATVTSTIGGGDTGNGTSSLLAANQNTLAGDYVCTFTDATHYTVVGPDGGTVGSGVTGTTFTAPSTSIYAGLAFRLTAGGTAFVAHDIFTIHVPACGKYVAYAHANTDGSQNAKMVLKYDVVTDNQGNVMYGVGVTNGEHGAKSPTAVVYTKGEFKTGDLPGLDSNAIPNPFILKKGDLTNGGVVELL